MMKKTLLIAALAIAGTSFAQKKTSTAAIISFDATTPSDALPKAENKTAIAMVDTKARTIAFEAQIKGFSFSNAMMQDHFNGGRWMDSEKFPTSSFKGKITNAGDIQWEKDGIYNAKVEGELNMHGITKPLSTEATFTVKGGKIVAESSFTIKGADYGIGTAGGKVAEEPKISVTAELK
jgi:polyisoprenoid-binding protein YceI